MSRWKWNWLTTLLTSAGALSVSALGCGDTTNNYASCGPGTRHDPDLNACVPIEDGGGADAGDAGDAGTTGSDAAGDVEADAGNEAGVEAGPEPQPGDDTCRTDVEYISNGDKACGTYNPVEVCSGTEPDIIELERLTGEDLIPDDPLDPTTGGIWVRTPSHPGVNPACDTGCSRPGTVARVRIPIRSDNATAPLYVFVRHEDETNPIAPWRISNAKLNYGCVNNWNEECYRIPVDPGEEYNILIETSDPEAPARTFHIYTYPLYEGGCDASL